MQESGNSVIPGGSSRDKGQMGARHSWRSEDCRRLRWPSQSEPGTAGAVGAQEALEVK